MRKSPKSKARESGLIDTLIGAAIRSHRERKGWSQEALATRCELSFQQIQKYEKGANRVSASRLHQFATLFGIKPADLFPQMPGASKAATDSASADVAELAAFAASREGSELLTAFSALRDRRIRHEMIRLMRLLTDDEDHNDG